jgi:hypothetical protein
MPGKQLERAAFDYRDLDKKTAQAVQGYAEEIRGLAKRVTADLVKIGQVHRKVRDILKPKKIWGKWIKAELGWSDETVRLQIALADFWEQNPEILAFEPSAGYEVVKESTPQAVRDAVLEKARRGEVIDYTTIKGLIEEHKQRVFIEVHSPPPEKIATRIVILQKPEQEQEQDKHFYVNLPAPSEGDAQTDRRPESPRYERIEFPRYEGPIVPAFRTADANPEPHEDVAPRHYKNGIQGKHYAHEEEIREVMTAVKGALDTMNTSTGFKKMVGHWPDKKRWEFCDDMEALSRQLRKWADELRHYSAD